MTTQPRSDLERVLAANSILVHAIDERGMIIGDETALGRYHYDDVLEASANLDPDAKGGARALARFWIALDQLRTKRPKDVRQGYLDLIKQLVGCGYSKHPQHSTRDRVRTRYGWGTREVEVWHGGARKLLVELILVDEGQQAIAWDVYEAVVSHPDHPAHPPVHEVLADVTITSQPGRPEIGGTRPDDIVRTGPPPRSGYAEHQAAAALSVLPMRLDNGCRVVVSGVGRFVDWRENRLPPGVSVEHGDPLQLPESVRVELETDDDEPEQLLSALYVPADERDQARREARDIHVSVAEAFATLGLPRLHPDATAIQVGQHVLEHLRLRVSRELVRGNIEAAFRAGAMIGQQLHEMSHPIDSPQMIEDALGDHLATLGFNT